MVQMSPVDMDKHLEKCEFKKYALEPVVHECHFKSFGCTKHFGSVTDLESHEKTNVQDHLRVRSPLVVRVIHMNYLYYLNFANSKCRELINEFRIL